jgi:hypothetical protein
MTVLTYSQAKQKFGSILDIAEREGVVQIRRKDGSLFSLSPFGRSKHSALDIRGIRTRATTSDILSAIRQSRSR